MCVGGGGAVLGHMLLVVNTYKYIKRRICTHVLRIFAYQIKNVQASLLFTQIPHH